MRQSKSILIELNDDGSSVFLCEIKINVRLAEYLHQLQCDKPALVKRVFTSYLKLLESRWF